LTETAFALRVRDVTFSYGTTPALTAVSLNVRSGDICFLLGPNGAGKTTLFSLISRLLACQAGDIDIAGQTLQRRGSQALADVGIVFQQPTLDLDLSVRQNLRYFAALRGLRKADADPRILEELTRIGIAERVDERVRALNGGHRRRVEIVRALMFRPKLLLLDEPTVGLDAQTRRALVRFVHAEARQRGLAVLWATHLLDEAESDDDLVMLAGGRVVASGKVSAVLASAGASTLEGAFTMLAGAVSEVAP
jgi:ABC-2 type transport system ATP-binding protein